MQSKIIFPPFLNPGDLVKVIAPSGALREFTAFEKGIKIWQSQGYRVELGSHYNAVDGYLAGTDCQRRQDLLEVWNNPNYKAILCARGGYGSARLLEDFSWNINQDNSFSPKWVIGFSDVTGLLWSLAKMGISGIHGPVLTTLAKEPEWSIKRLFAALEGRPLEHLIGKGWGGEKVIGRLITGNLTVATHLLGTEIQPNLDGVILALEDVAEAPYRIDRLLTQWRMIGALKNIKGIALGRFSRCEPPEGISSWTIQEVLRDRLGDLNIPIVSDLPFGHDGVNAALPVGEIVELDANKGTLEIINNK